MLLINTQYLVALVGVHWQFFNEQDFYIYIYMSKLDLKLLNLHGCFMIWTWILHDFRNSKGYSGVMDFNDTVHIFEVGSHLFESCKHPSVNAIQHFTLYTRLHFYTWDKHNVKKTFIWSITFSHVSGEPMSHFPSTKIKSGSELSDITEHRKNFHSSPLTK